MKAEKAARVLVDGGRSTSRQACYFSPDLSKFTAI
jgi:hypothetical protein